MTKVMRWRRRLLTAIAVLSLILTYMVGFVYAKYVQIYKTNGTVTVTVDIGTIELREHEAVQNPDGSYSLTDTQLPDETKTGNNYILLPGLDVPKDPHVVVTKPNNLPVYIYVEVVDNLESDSGISYSMSNWTELTGVTGPHGGKVYYYNSKVETTETIYILDKNMVYVSQELDKDIEDLHLKFYAYMYQAEAGKDAAEVYSS